jgi:ribonucleotide monophosphatase NagD (HAD superfamily)
MVGDRLSTDILFGSRGNLKTLLVFTGVTTKEELESPENTIFPNFSLDALGQLHQLAQ